MKNTLLSSTFNPYMFSFPQMDPWKIERAQIRRRRMGHLIMAHTDCKDRIKWRKYSRHPLHENERSQVIIRGVIEKFISFFHRIIIYGWIYIIFCHYQQQPVVNRKKTLKCKVRHTCDVTMTLMTSHVGDVVVKTLEDRCGWRPYLTINAILPVRLLWKFQTIFVHKY